MRTKAGDPYTDPNSMVQMNEKARMRGLSYGKYVLARWLGQYEEDEHLIVPLNYEFRQAYLNSRKRPK